MSWSDLDTVHGIAIDSKGTLAHHQLVSINRKKHLLNYTVFYAPSLKDNHYSQETILKFVEQMQSVKPHTEAEWHEVAQSYSNFMQTIRPHGSHTAFCKKIPAKALTFDIEYDHHFKPCSMSFRPTIGIMERAMTCGEAKREMRYNKNLQAIHDVAANLPSNKSRKPISFEMVTFHLTQYIAEQKLAQDFLTGEMDTIFRTIEKTGNPQDASNTAQEVSYHSLMAYMYQNEEEVLKLPKNAVSPITASRVDICHYNIMETAESILNGVSPFPKGTTESFVNYKTIRKTRPHNGLIALRA